MNERNGENVERDIDTRKRNPLKGFWLKISYSLNTYGFFLLSPSRMSQLKHTAVLRGDVLQDVATGQMFMLHPTNDTSPEVDFEQFDYWALGLNSHLWRINLYKECNDGFWTL